MSELQTKTLEDMAAGIPARDAEIAALRAERDRYREALADLVACDALKRRIAVEQATMISETDSDFEELDALMLDLAARQPVAWEKARAALSQGD